MINKEYFIMDSFNTSDFYLRSLANQLGREWKELATNLGFRSDEVDRIIMNHPHDTSESIYAVLTQWRNRNGADVYAGFVLENALKKSGRQDLAVKIKEHYPPLVNTAVQSHHQAGLIHMYQHDQPRLFQPPPTTYLLPVLMILQLVPYPMLLPYQAAHTAVNQFTVYRGSAPVPLQYYASTSAASHFAGHRAFPWYQPSNALPSLFTNQRAALCHDQTRLRWIATHQPPQSIHASGAGQDAALPDQDFHTGSNHFAH